jgi:membrane fusion protein (multidrug efflux system)
MSKRTKRILIWSLLIAAVAALAIPKLITHSPKGEGAAKGEAPARAAAPGGSRGAGRGGGGSPVAVEAVVVGTGEMADRLRVSGTVLPNESVDLQSEVSGKIVGIYFREGQPVARGQLLVKINDADLQAQLKRAELEKTLAASKEARQKQLIEKKAISPSDYDVALNELNTASAEIELVKAQIAKTEIRAPFAGVVGLRNVSVGSYIAPTTKIATFSSTNPVKIDFFVPEKYLGVVRPGSTVAFSIAGSSGQVSGRVYAVEPRVEQATRTLQVRATAPNPGGRLVPGSFAEVEVTLSRFEQAMTVPTEAIVPQPGGKMAVFIARNGKAESRPIDVGLRTPRSVQVLSGLAPGDTVISSGVQLVKPGGAVKVTMVDAAEKM